MGVRLSCVFVCVCVCVYVCVCPQGIPTKEYKKTLNMTLFGIMSGTMLFTP